MEIAYKIASICKKKFRILRTSSPHNPEVVGSSPASATKEPPKSSDLGGSSMSRGQSGFEPNFFDPNAIRPVNIDVGKRNF